MARNQILTKKKDWQSQHIPLVNSFFFSPRWLCLISSLLNLPHLPVPHLSLVLWINRNCHKRNLSFPHPVYRPAFICTHIYSLFLYKGSISCPCSELRQAPLLVPRIPSFLVESRIAFLWVSPSLPGSSISPSLLDYSNKNTYCSISHTKNTITLDLLSPST